LCRAHKATLAHERRNKKQQRENIW
jgi:hypothetical protein